MNRAFFFIDGNNWYHSLRNAGISRAGSLKLSKVCEKLSGPARTWTGTRYYVGRVNQRDEPRLYAEQRRYQLQIEAEDRRIEFAYGRLERRPRQDTTATVLHEYLASLSEKLPLTVYRRLSQIAMSKNDSVVVEKAVDVMLAVDMVALAYQNSYDAAYLLSGDGDFTPAIDAVRKLGKKVYVASPAVSSPLRQTAHASIKLTPNWLTDCW